MPIITVNGEQREVDEAELITLAQKGVAADQRFQEASALAKQYEGIGTPEEITTFKRIVEAINTNPAGSVTALIRGMKENNALTDDVVQQIQEVAGLPSNPNGLPGAPPSTGDGGVLDDLGYLDDAAIAALEQRIASKLADRFDGRLSAVEGGLKGISPAVGELAQRTVTQDLQANFPNLDVNEVRNFAKENGIQDLNTAALALIGKNSLSSDQDSDPGTATGYLPSTVVQETATIGRPVSSSTANNTASHSVVSDGIDPDFQQFLLDAQAAVSSL